MKRFKLLFLAAAIIGIGSAFTTVGGGEEYVRLAPDSYQLKTEAVEHGFCDELTNEHCTYTAIVENPNLNDDDDFTPIDQDMVWVENP